MTEINTFSSAVDDTVVRCGRLDRRTDIISFVRMSIRELQTVRGFLFDYDIVEDVLTANAEPYVWTPDIVLTKIWRTMRSVQYPGIYAPDGKPIYADYIPIGKKQGEHDYYYYKSGDAYVFSGASGGTNALVSINIAYYAYVGILAYYATLTDRPATFSLEDNIWSYATASTDVDKILARDLVTNWVLEKWYDAVVEGSLAKIFKTVADERARSSFALYSSYKKTLAEAEPRSAFGPQV